MSRPRFPAGAPGALDEDGRPTRRGFAEARVTAVEDAAGELPMPVLLHCRVRYFTHGVILGGRRFADEAVRRHGAHFSAKRKTGARLMKGQWNGICTARRLRMQVFALPQRC